MYKKLKKLNLKVIFHIIFLMFILNTSFAESLPNITINVGGEQGVSSGVQVILLLTILSIAPAILLMMTSFTRIIVIFSFLRRALGLQTTPPNQVLIALSLFLTFYIMSPVFVDVYNQAYVPFTNGQINQEEAYHLAMKPFRKFMFENVRKDDLALFTKLVSNEDINSLDKIKDVSLIPAFAISELKTAFIVGFKLYIPFIVIDMVVASTLMALGMMMLPPVVISLPFKILIFVLVDGWNLLTNAIIAGYM